MGGKWRGNSGFTFLVLKESEMADRHCAPAAQSCLTQHTGWIRCPRYLLKLEQGRAVGRWRQPGSLCVWIVKVLPRREVSWGRVEFPALPGLGFEGRDCGFH